MPNPQPCVWSMLVWLRSMSLPTICNHGPAVDSTLQHHGSRACSTSFAKPSCCLGRTTRCGIGSAPSPVSTALPTACSQYCGGGCGCLCLSPRTEVAHMDTDAVPMSTLTLTTMPRALARPTSEAPRARTRGPDLSLELSLPIAATSAFLAYEATPLSEACAAT